MTSCILASDLHGVERRYVALLRVLRSERPAAVFLAGDLLPHSFQEEFLGDWLLPRLRALRQDTGGEYPRIFALLGNDDHRSCEAIVREAEAEGLWQYANERRLQLGDHPVFGYAYVPPTPFRLKDFERYDVSRFVDPGCVSPEEGVRSVPVEASEARLATIADDLDRLAGSEPLSDAIILFHAPPYRTALDRAALDGRSVDHVPLDVHVGSIAIRRFLEARQPLLALHGHVHESARLTGSWQDRIGRTHCLSAAHDGLELALVRFAPEDPGGAGRELIAPEKEEPAAAPPAPGGRT